MKNIEIVERVESKPAQLHFRLRKPPARRRRVAPATAAWWFHQMRTAAERGCAPVETSEAR